MSQPCDRSAKVPLPGKLDASLKEFWTENPWDIVREGHNLSAFERNRTWLNVNGKAFLDVSYLTGADSDGDGRGVVAADFRNSGQVDLIVRQVSGGPLRLYENNLPRGNFLSLTLRGNESNRHGIGARVVAEVNGRKIVRELYPADGFRCQQASRLHLGLGDADRVDRLTIRWPSRSDETQVLTNVQANRHLIVTEGKVGAEAIEVVTPGTMIHP